MGVCGSMKVRARIRDFNQVVDKRDTALGPFIEGWILFVPPQKGSKGILGFHQGLLQFIFILQN